MGTSQLEFESWEEIEAWVKANRPAEEAETWDEDECPDPDSACWCGTCREYMSEGGG